MYLCDLLKLKFINNFKLTKKMKKVILLTLGLVLGFSAIAQKANIDKSGKNIKVTVSVPSQERISDGSAVEGMTFTMPTNMMSASYRSEDDFEEYESMVTNYDLQSNSTIGNRIAVWPDGTASFVATWDKSNNTSFPDRGTGYNFYDGIDMGEMPTARQEDVKSGWPSIAKCGEGEVLTSHASGVNVYYRATKGQGSWTLLKNFGTEYNTPTWARVVCSGDNDEYIHIVMAKQIGSASPYDNHVYYVRSNDRGQTWGEMIDLPLIDNDDVYLNNFSADDYVMAANGNTVAILLGAYTTDVVYIISHDNGETWEKQIVAQFPIEGAHAYDWDNNPDGWWSPLCTSDNSHSIAIDDNGVVHVVFGLFRWQAASGDSYTYWPVYNYGVIYWNSEYTNEQGGPEIPLLGDWSGDAQVGWGDTLGYSLDVDRVVALCEADGGQHLWISGYPVEIDEETGDTLYYESAHFLSAPYSYRSHGNVTTPSISIDEKGHIAIIYNIRSKARINGTTDMYYRSAYVTCRDRDGKWFDDAINLSESFEHSMDEVYPTTASAVAYDGEFWAYYSADMYQGLYLDISDSYPNSNQATLTDNTIYAIKITPNMEGWDGVEEHELVNPLTTTRVFPNPATDMMTVEINASQDAEATISVYNITGQSIMDMNVNVNTGINHSTINTSELSSGVYFVTVNANGFSKTTKVVVK